MHTKRLESIMCWLAENREGLVVRHHVGYGFFVPRGKQVTFQDGAIVDAVDWLLKEGFADGLIVGGFQIVYAPPGSHHGERITFFPIDIYRVPFNRSA